MIGLALMLVPVSWEVAGTAALAVPVVLGGRWLAVATSMSAFPAIRRSIRRSIPHSVKILTWGGLRGGLSVAMALAR